MRCDAVVSAAYDETRPGGAGACAAVRRAVGTLLRACGWPGGGAVGEAKVTRGYRLPCRYIIHTVGPVWRGGGSGEEALLRACYKNSLLLARKKRCRSIAFPLISSGACGYPKDRALRAATKEIAAFLAENEMTVYIVVPDSPERVVSKQLYGDIAAFIDRCGGEGRAAAYRMKALVQRAGEEDDLALPAPVEHAAPAPGSGPDAAWPRRTPDLPFADAPMPLNGPEADAQEEQTFLFGDRPDGGGDEVLSTGALGPSGLCPAADAAPAAFAFESAADSAAPAGPDGDERVSASIPAADDIGETAELFLQPCRQTPASLDDALKQLDESFSEMLLRKIDEKGMTDVECYKKANIDRKLFSKIRGDKNYRPGKATAIAFAVALELPLDEFKSLLMKAGFALSHSSRFDIIVEYFVMRGNYDLFELNEALFAFDQPTL